MSDTTVIRCRKGHEVTDVVLPMDLEAVLAGYADLSRAMARAPVPETFSRDEWGYLSTFLRALADGAVLEEAFGPREARTGSLPTRLARPKEQITLWLPNNVSLLGPLTVILCLLTGARVRAKAGSSAADLTGDLRRFILNADVGAALQAMWTDRLETAQFSRHDARNAAWSETADARIFFGGDQAAQAVGALPHKPGSAFFAFADHSSQIWADAAALDDRTLETILRVFHVYGKAGCTSPQRVVLIGADRAAAEDVVERLAALADRQLQASPPAHIASDTLMAAQIGRAKGWRVARAAGGGVVFAAGSDVTDDIPGLMTLCVVPAGLDAACAALPPNIQTIGHAASPDVLGAWITAVSQSPALRLVPVRRMHHFGPFWDGQAFWRGLFRETEVAQ